jgi:hypothetical protein
MKIDHVVQLVENLDQAIVQWKGMGFTVSPGGVHADGLTHNALVIFRDGSYIELLAFRSQDTGNHRWARYRGFWGPIDYAISMPDLTDFAAQLQTKGLPYTAPYEGGRTRPDGIALRWRGIIPTDVNRGLPFFIEDLTDRALRVPTRDENVLHDNAASGIAQVRVDVPRLDAVDDDFEALFGEGAERANAEAFKLHGSTLTLSQPAAGSTEAQYITQRGAGPIAVTIAAPVPIVIKPVRL